MMGRFFFAFDGSILGRLTALSPIKTLLIIFESKVDLYRLLNNANAHQAHVYGQSSTIFVTASDTSSQQHK